MYGWDRNGRNAENDQPISSAAGFWVLTSIFNNIWCPKI
jgi:hypothetical protein